MRFYYSVKYRQWLSMNEIESLFLCKSLFADELSFVSVLIYWKYYFQLNLNPVACTKYGTTKSENSLVKAM